MKEMKSERFMLAGIPARRWEAEGDALLLAVHGRCGSKDGYGFLADLLGMTTVAIDLPGHGERQGSLDRFTPWEVVPELRAVLRELSHDAARVYLFAESIGAYFSLRAFGDRPLSGCLFLSPLTDMHGLILSMMASAGISEERLEREKVIETTAGTVEWQYLTDAREHPVVDWRHPTAVLTAEADPFTAPARLFAQRNGADMTVMPGGKHWFHTPEETAFRDAWITAAKKFLQIP